MRVNLFFLIAIILISCSHRPPADKEKLVMKTQVKKIELQKVFEFRGTQPTGVTISEDGRMLVNFPRWRDDIPYSVVEIDKEGKISPYPNKDWNNWRGKPEPNKFSCVQSVHAHGNSLYVLDASNPLMKGVVGRPTLYEFFLGTNTLRRSWSMGPDVAPLKSYLNDLKIDEQNQKIFITDSGLGALIEIDMLTGKATRKLDQDPSTKSEDFHLMVNNKPFAPDGTIFDSPGNLYMADLENNAIVYRTPAGELKTLIQDDRISWAYSFSIYDNHLYFTDSKLGETQMGKSVDKIVFPIYKVPLAL